MWIMTPRRSQTYFLGVGVWLFCAESTRFLFWNPQGVSEMHILSVPCSINGLQTFCEIFFPSSENRRNVVTKPWTWEVIWQILTEKHCSAGCHKALSSTISSIYAMQTELPGWIRGVGCFFAFLDFGWSLIITISCNDVSKERCTLKNEKTFADFLQNYEFLHTGCDLTPTPCSSRLQSGPTKV